MTQVSNQKVLVAVPNSTAYLPMESALSQAGFEVTIALSTATALTLIASEQPDFIVIDNEVPHMGGIRLCRRIRRDQGVLQLRIIMIITPQDLANSIQPKDEGADDYLVKPFDMGDLLTRTIALQPSRGKDRFYDVLKAGTIEMVPEQWTVYVDEEQIRLTEIEYRLLLELIKVKGRVLTRDTLMERVWGHTKAHQLETRTLDVHMSRLRQKLGISAKNIITVRNVGYRMNVSPAWLNY